QPGQGFHQVNEAEQAQVPTTQSQTTNTPYIAAPIVENGQTVGALFLAAPTPPERTPYPFLGEVNLTIFLSGIVISLIVVVVSFVLAKRFTHPIEVLTGAAEQM